MATGENYPGFYTQPPHEQETTLSEVSRGEVISRFVTAYKDHFATTAMVEARRSHNPTYSGDIIGDYLAEAASFPLLSEDDESELFSSIEQGCWLYSDIVGLDNTLPPDYEDIFIHAAAAHQIVFRSNMRLAFSIAKKYRDPQKGGMEWLDHLRNADEGLLMAIDHFDVQMGNRFSTYATHCIHSKVNRMSVEQSHTIRIPPRKFREYSRSKGQVEYHRLTTGHTLSPDEIEKITGIPYKEYQGLQYLGDQPPLSFERTVSGMNALTLGATIGYDHIDDDLVSTISDHEEAASILAGADLTERERWVLGLSFGLEPHLVGNPSITIGDDTVSYASFSLPEAGASDGHSLAEIGRMMGVSRERARVIEKTALEKIRKSLKYDDNSAEEITK